MVHFVAPMRPNNDFAGLIVAYLYALLSVAGILSKMQFE